MAAFSLKTFRLFYQEADVEEIGNNIRHNHHKFINYMAIGIFVFQIVFKVRIFFKDKKEHIIHNRNQDHSYTNHLICQNC